MLSVQSSLTRVLATPIVNQTTLSDGPNKTQGQCKLLPRAMLESILLSSRTLPACHVGGRYRIIERLGAGGYGCVMAGQDSATGSRVALKFIDKRKVPSSNLVRDSSRPGFVPLEVDVLRTTRHPNMIGYIDHFELKHAYCLVMELHGSEWHSTSRSRDLFECIESQQRLTPWQAHRVFGQLVQVVCFLKANGVYHRDIKDENVVIDHDYRAKLIDFGSAIRDTRLCTHFRGTESFASPEALSGNSYMAEPAEVWSLGVLLYIMLCGGPPFSSARHLGSNAQWRPLLPDSLAACRELVQGMLCVDPQARWTLDQVRRHPWVTGKLIINHEKG